MGKKHYLETDGNGGFRVSKSIAFPAIFTITFLVLSSFATIVMAWQGVEDDVNDIKNWIKTETPKHDVHATELEQRIENNEVKVALTSQKIDTLCEDITEIKLTLREINEELRRNK